MFCVQHFEAHTVIREIRRIRNALKTFKNYYMSPSRRVLNIRHRFLFWEAHDCVLRRWYTRHFRRMVEEDCPYLMLSNPSHFNILAATRCSRNFKGTVQLQSLVPTGFSFTSVQTAGAHWLADAIHPFGIRHAVWCGQVQTNALSRINCTVMLSHDSFEIRFGR